MNNNDMNFDPMTGQPIPKENINFDPVTGQPISNIEPNGQELQNAIINEQPQNTESNSQDSLKNIATIEQSSDEFINNSQNAISNPDESTQGKTNWGFIIVLFIIIFAAIFFLFPYLIKKI